MKKRKTKKDIKPMLVAELKRIADAYAKHADKELSPLSRDLIARACSSMNWEVFKGKAGDPIDFTGKIDKDYPTSCAEFRHKWYRNGTHQQILLRGLFIANDPPVWSVIYFAESARFDGPLGVTEWLLKELRK